MQFVDAAHEREVHGRYSSKKTFASWPQIRDFFAQNPEANFAAATGPASNLVVIDVDGAAGAGSLRALIRKNGKLKRSVRVKTPRGYHFYYSWPGRSVANSVSKVAESIDVRGHNGYIILPGSRGEDGCEYRFLDGYGIDEVAIAGAPDWLVEMIATQPASPSANSNRKPGSTEPEAGSVYGRKALKDELARVEVLAEGQRNDGLNKAAFRMGRLVVKGELDNAAITKALLGAAVGTGLSEAESTRTIASGLAAGRSSSRLYRRARDRRHLVVQ